MWQDVYEELREQGLVVITVAFDKSAEDARPWIEAAGATHPSLIDCDHVVADLYNMVNVPTVVWIDEQGRVVRPNDVHYVSDEYTAVHGLRPEKPLAALRAWVRGEAPALSGGSVEELRRLPSEDDQRARAEFALAWWLHQNGHTEAAEVHFQRAGELAPHDFTIRRGSMPITGRDAAGPEFWQMVKDWRRAGNEYYLPLPDTV